VKGRKVAQPQPNYLRKLRYLWKIGAIPRDVGVHMVTVSHDDWCGIYQQKPCNCDPDSRLKATVPGAMH
jgi:hypothetical protein